MRTRPAALLINLLMVPAMWCQTTYPFVIKTLAGSNPTGDNGPAKSALLQFPAATAMDKTGNVYIADGGVNGIRKVATDGTITTISGIGALDLKVDSAGNVYGVDGVSAAFKITPSGALSLIAGGTLGSGGDGGPATQAGLAYPAGIALDGAGNIYIADTFNCKIRMVNPTGIISTVVGTGVCGHLGDNSLATKVRIAYPTSVVLDSAGTMYIGEYGYIRKVAPDQTVSTIAGLGNSVVDGPATQSAVGTTLGLALDSAGNLYIADADNNRVRTITGLNIKTIAGKSSSGFSGDSGPASAALLSYPTGVLVDSKGNLYIADQNNNRIRLVNNSLTISTFAGANHFAGDNGSATSALLNLPAHSLMDASGNLFIADTMNNRIRKVSASGTITTVAGTGVCAYTGDNGPAASAAMCLPGQLALDSTGRLYFADTGNSVVRRIETSGAITTFAGTGTFGDTGDGAAATAAQFELPVGLAFDASGNLFVSDNYAHRVRKIGVDGKIAGFAGSLEGFSGDGNLATAARLDSPGQLAASGADVYIADTYNYRVRKVSNGVITTIAGTSTCCAVTAQANGTYIGRPGGLTVDSAGGVYIAEEDYDSIVKVTPDNKMVTVAGTGSRGFSGDGGLASAATMIFPGGLSTDSAGDLYLSDKYNNRIRKLTMDSPTQMTAGSGDLQTGVPGAVLPVPLAVQVNFRAGVGVRGIPISFAVTAGSATLTAATATTDSTGLAGVGVTLGKTAGQVVVTATLAGLPPVLFHLTAAVAVPLPTFTAGGVVGAGGSIPAVTQISTGGLATIFGSNFAPAGTSRGVQADDLVNGILPTTLAGVCVQVGGQPAYLTYVNPTQVNIQVPNVPAGDKVAIIVTINCGTANALQSAPVTVSTAAATPEFLFWLKNASGKNPVIAINAVTYGYIGASGLISGLTFVPAKPGDILTIYGVSFGPTNPAVAPGASSASIAGATNTPTVQLGSTTLTLNNVLLYAGISPGTAGLYQVNIQVPAGLADGDYPIVLNLGSFSTPAGAYLTVKN
jgi:trimeric autotransporter adhesin